MDGRGSLKDIRRTRVPLATDGNFSKKQGRIDSTTPKAWNTETTSESGTSYGKSRTYTGRNTASAAETGTSMSPYRNEDPLRGLVPIRGGLGSHSHMTIPQELNGADLVWTQRIEQVWSDLSYANKLVYLFREMQHNTLVVGHSEKRKIGRAHV